MTGKLIGLIGYKGSGKSSLTDEALHTWDGVRAVRMGFADPMRDMIAALGVPAEILHDKARWDEPLEILCGKSTRHAVVTIGTEWGRQQIGEEIWTRIAMHRSEKLRSEGKNVIIDNVRFPIEANTIRERGGILIAFKRPMIALDTAHESEQHIEALQRDANITFFNSLHFAESAKQWKNLLHKLLDD